MSDTEPVLDAMAQYSQEFDDMSQARWDMGAEQYGSFKFLENDVIQMTIEELVDMSNYARMQVIKLRMLQDMLVDSGYLDKIEKPTGVDDAGNILMSMPSFVPSAKFTQMREGGQV